PTCKAVNFRTYSSSTGPSTPETSPLSLHDALPILVEGARSVANGTRQMLYRADPYQVDVSIERKPGANRIVVTGQLQNSRQPDLDRKSTRLNSSHRTISYAVFCLKKENEFLPSC